MNEHSAPITANVTTVSLSMDKKFIDIEFFINKMNKKQKMIRYCVLNIKYL
jgi:hypothetical protein